MTEYTPRVAFFYRRIGGGGAERMLLNVARGFAERGLAADLVLCTANSPHMDQVSPKVRVVDLQASGLFASIPKLAYYLRTERPVALLSTLHYTNEVAIWAKYLAGAKTRIVVREANHLSREARYDPRWRYRLTPLFARQFYPWADSIVAVSQGVALDLSQVTRLPEERIRVIYNPTITPEFTSKIQEPIDHPWFSPGQLPVILGVGKLEAQKDFPTLIRAFAQVRQKQKARLVILGWGPDRPRLEALIQELGIQDDVDLAGHVKNPLPYMARAAMFVLSSGWEGLPNVLIEAMATGIPVISTNCKSGPAEILDNGNYGLLTPVGDNQALAEAILDVFAGKAKSVDPSWLKQFTLENSIQAYLDIMGLTVSNSKDPHYSSL